MLAAVTALAAVTVLAGAKLPHRPLPGQAIAMVAAAAALFGAVPLGRLLLGGPAGVTGGARLVAATFSAPSVSGLLSGALFALLPLTVLLAVRRMRRAERRRALLLFVPVVTAWVVSTSWSAASSSGGLFPPAALVNGLLAGHPAAAVLAFWAVFLGVPAFAFAVSVVLLGRYERMPRLVAAGQQLPD
jgi:hypothetical protein